MAGFHGSANAAVPMAQTGQGSTPVIDGRLDDPGWQACAQLLPFIEAEGTGLAKTQTRALVFHNDRALFIAFRCDEPKVAELHAHCKKRDSGVWRDDCVEVFLQRPGQNGFYQITVNSLGTVYDAKDKSDRWNPALKIRAFTGEKEWGLELAIPWADLGGCPKIGEQWRVNFCRERKVGKELSCWSCTYGKFHKTERFGILAFAKSAVRLERLDLQPPVPGANLAHVELKLPHGAAADVVAPEAKPVRLAAGGGGIRLTYPLGLSAGETVFEARVQNRSVWRAAFPVNIQPRPQLAALEAAHKGLQAIQSRLAKDTALYQSLAEAMSEAQGPVDAMRKAIDGSLAKGKPLGARQYQGLNAAVAASAKRLSLMRWPIWTKSNWLDIGRAELPPAPHSIAELTFTSLVNEYESGNVIITNLGDQPLRLRVTASDLQWSGALPASGRSLLKNSRLEEDSNKDGVPDDWHYAKGARSHCSLVRDRGRGNVLAISQDVVGRSFTVRQNLKLKEGQSYTVAYRAKSEGAGPGVRVAVINKGWTWSTGPHVPPHTDGWRRVEFSFTPRPSPFHQLVIWGNPQGKGKVWLDDFSLVEGGRSVKTFAGTAPKLSVPDWQELRGGQTVADPLMPMDPSGRVDVPSGESRQIWITLPARDLPPGEYQCALNMRPLAVHALEGAPPSKSVRLGLTVKPLRLTTSPEFAVYNWDYARDETYVRDLFDHKVNFFNVSTHMQLPKFDEAGSPLGKPDFASYDRMLRIKMRYARKAGGQIFFAYGIIRDFHRRASKLYGYRFMDSAWVRAFRYAYGEWLRHLKALGLRYDEFCVQVWDEATGANVDYVVEGGKLLREIDPKVRLVMDGAQSLEEVKRIDPYIDVWVPHLTTLLYRDETGELLKYYKQTGEPVYCYTCSTFMKARSPYSYHRLKPWQAASLGLDGTFYWAYNSWRGDPWNDFDGPIADCGVVYPGADGPITSRRWEASREGIEDWQIIRLLERLGGQADDRGEAIRKIIDRAIEQVRVEPTEVGRADRYRLELIAAATEMAQANPLRITDIEQVTKGRRLSVSFATNRPASGKLLHRLVGTDTWRDVALPRGSKHQAHVGLPPEAQADWIALMWDEVGRVAHHVPQTEE